jgi:hypothetical protein
MGKRLSETVLKSGPRILSLPQVAVGLLLAWAIRSDRHHGYATFEYWQGLMLHDGLPQAKTLIEKLYAAKLECKLPEREPPQWDMCELAEGEVDTDVRSALLDVEDGFYVPVHCLDEADHDVVLKLSLSTGYSVGFITTMALIFGVRKAELLPGSLRDWADGWIDDWRTYMFNEGHDNQPRTVADQLRLTKVAHNPEDEKQG